MSQENVETVREAVAAFNRGGREEVRAGQMIWVGMFLSKSEALEAARLWE